MNTKDNHETNNQPITIEDLNAHHADTIRGGSGDDKRLDYMRIELKEVMVS